MINWQVGFLNLESLSSDPEISWKLLSLKKIMKIISISMKIHEDFFEKLLISN